MRSMTEAVLIERTPEARPANTLTRGRARAVSA